MGDKLCLPNYYWHTRIFRPSDGPASKLAAPISSKQFFDLFQIPGADTAAIAAISAAALTNGGRVCGRVLASVTAAESDDTIAGVGTVCGK